MDEQRREPVEELTLEPPGSVRTRRPRALWAVIAIVGLAAGALVVTSSDDDGGDPPGLPVQLALGGSGGGEGAADASRMAWVTYVPGDDLPSLGGEGSAYRLSGGADEARVRALADAVGLGGSPIERTEAGWSVTGEGDLGRLDVYSGGGAHWSWFAGHQDCVTDDGSVGVCAEECTVDADGNERCSKTFTEPGAPLTTTTAVEGPVAAPSSGACPAPEPPEELEGCDDVVTTVVPDSGSGCADGDDCIDSDARPDGVASVEPPEPVEPPREIARVALAIAAAAGHDVADAIVSAVPSGREDAEQWYVAVEPRLDGVPSGLSTYVEVSSDLQARSGGGVLGGVEDLGEYPLLDTKAAIERANELAGTAVVAVDGATSTRDATTAGGGESGSQDVGGSTDIGEDTPGVAPTTTTMVDPCAVPEGASDGCGGTTGCGGDGCVDPAEPLPCKVQPDGREICEVVECFTDVAMGAPEGSDTTTGGADGSSSEPVECPPVDCPQALAEGDGGDVAEAPPAPGCTPPPYPEPIPEPPAVEIVLVDAERSLVLLPASDGSDDAYLVPAYRFTDEDGGQVDLPAVADEALTGPPSTETTVPDTVLPPPQPTVPEPQPCEVLEEGDASGTTHTIQTCPTPNEDGVHVDAFVMDGHCTWLVVKLDGKVWWTPGYYEDDLYGWSQPTEPGTLTIHPDGTADFVSDADPERRATLEPWEGDGEGPLCE